MEIFFNLFSCGRKYNHGRHKLGIGLGFNWKNYRMTGYTRFVKDGAGISLSPYPDNANIDFSRLKIFSITFPLEYKYKFHKDFAISAAAILNWNAYGSLKTKYELDNRKIEECSEQIKHCPVSIALRMGLHWKSLGAYVKYSPCNVIHCEYGPQFNGLAAGVMIGLYPNGDNSRPTRPIPDRNDKSGRACSAVHTPILYYLGRNPIPAVP